MTHVRQVRQHWVLTHAQHTEYLHMHNTLSTYTCTTHWVLTHAQHTEYLHMHNTLSTYTCTTHWVLTHAQHTEYLHMHNTLSTYTCTTVGYWMMCFFTKVGGKCNCTWTAADCKKSWALKWNEHKKALTTMKWIWSKVSFPNTILTVTMRQTNLVILFNWHCFFSKLNL